MNGLLSTLLAHQGGWDEALLIAGPIVVIAGLLMLAKRRVDAMGDDRRPAGAEPESATSADQPSR